MEFGSKIWLNGKILDANKTSTSLFTYSLHYSTGVFEGIRCFKAQSGLMVFRLKEHIARLFNSAKEYGIKIPYTEEQIAEACKTVVRENGYRDFYIRPIIYYGAGALGLNAPGNPVETAIMVWMWPSYLGKEGEEKGVRCTVSSWRKIPNESLPQYAKCTANYANSSLAKRQATERGYEEAILLNTRDLVAECTGENLFIVKNGNLKTPQLSAGILEGITRDSIITIAKKLNISVLETDITKEELMDADEVFLTGTAAGIKLVSEIDGRKLDVQNAKVYKKLKSFYNRVISGQEPNFDEWLEKI